MLLQPSYFQIEQVSVFGARTPTYAAAKGDYWEDHRVNIVFCGNLTTGSAASSLLWDTVQNGTLHLSNQGRQKVPYILSQRNKLFCF